LGDARILVIEDDPGVREALEDALRGAGMGVDSAVDGIDGLERLRRGLSPSVILLDLRMPRLDGQAFLRELRADPRHAAVPVITMTAGTAAPGREDVLAHLQKPFDLDDLLGIIGSLCEPQAE